MQLLHVKRFETGGETASLYSKLLTIFAKIFIFHVWLTSEYASDISIF